MKKFDNIEGIEQYLEGTLEGDALASFENKLAKDNSFATEVELFMDMKETIRRTEQKKIQQSLKNVHNQLTEEKFFERQNKRTSQKPSSIFRVLSLAASVALLIGAAFFLFGSNQPTSAELFAAVYQPETNNITTIVEDLSDYGMVDPEAQRKDELIAALAVYESKNYAAAKTSLEAHLQKYPTDKIAQFYLGISLLETKDYQGATDYFSALTQDNTFELADDAEWYAALGNLGQNTSKKTQIAKLLLAKIAANNATTYQSKAKNILQQLDN